MDQRTETIRDINDRFRTKPGSVPGQVLITSCVQDLVALHEGSSLADIAKAVSEFHSFDEDNDPYGEHDFGAFDLLGRKLFWKIDYYGPGMESGSEDPADINQTVRVLTIMLANEY